MPEYRFHRVGAMRLRLRCGTARGRGRRVLLLARVVTSGTRLAGEKKPDRNSSLTSGENSYPWTKVIVVYCAPYLHLVQHRRAGQSSVSPPG